ncbi:HypC/HybG/HupF family hydrogenase formation chaperone [Anaeropeptidivorans aminofermentans]|uniref:HypC/HybG/HupF family hydrogenase formation chaperone n=1 Tax=Anaeropeptidivorans aminofermentans TaxID=2934315 RepID=UPI002024525A|nr:HypC/HybG/HupF family hydrogenase formation chaperone [Anaeropeptidivorans aminofermentans]MBE6012586.1 HypC/HybG/HupF family hydrogenase formation chaperone [Lachnospiraceae bacterium]
MCLAIPAKIMKIHNAHAEADIMGVRKKINILLVDDLHIGDKVMVHAGYAINKIDEAYFDFLENTLRKMTEDMP